MFGVGAGLSPKVFWGRLYCAPWAFKTAIVASWRFCVAAPKGVRPWAFGWFTLAPTFNRYLKKWLAKTGGLGSETTSTSPNKTPQFYTNYIYAHLIEQPKKSTISNMLPIPQPFNSFQWLQEFLSAIARGIVQPAVARAVYSIRVGTAVQEELHNGDTVGTDGITQGGDALVVLADDMTWYDMIWLSVKTHIYIISSSSQLKYSFKIHLIFHWNTLKKLKLDQSPSFYPLVHPPVPESLGIEGFLLLQKALDLGQIAALRRLVNRHGRLFDLLQDWVQLRRQTSHLLTDLQHQFLILKRFLATQGTIKKERFVCVPPVDSHFLAEFPMAKYQEHVMFSKIYHMSW